MPGPRRSHNAAASQPQPSAPIVSQRLCDLLLSFPAATVGGVQWQVLVRKYEDRYCTRLDLRELGYSTPLAAATALLWDVVRVVDKEDTDNPVVGIEDAVALTPQPGLLGSWPSLYSVLCDLVLNNGRATGDAEDDSGPRCLLVSQLRPLMERHWHASFDESAFGFLNEEGSFLKFKKMKHLLHACLRWRDQRVAWRKSHGFAPTAVDEALEPHLQVVPSSTHSDLVLICFANGDAAAVAAASAAATAAAAVAAATAAADTVASNEVSSSGEAAPPAPVTAPRARTAPQAAGASVVVGAAGVPNASAPSAAKSKPDFGSLQLELERLRGENEELRMRNQLLEQGGSSRMSGTPIMMMARAMCDLPTQLPEDVLDDPFEPPPEARSWRPETMGMPRKLCMEPAGAFSDVSSECSYDAALSSTASYASDFYGPFSGSDSAITSGAATPAHAAQQLRQQQQQHGCAFVPVWFAMMQTSEAPWSVIPRGIVKSAREHFERIAGNQLM